MTNDVTYHYIPTCIICRWDHPYCQTIEEGKAAISEHTQKVHPTVYKLWLYSEQLEQRVAELEAELAKFQECVVSKNSVWRSLGETCDESHWHKEGE